MGKYKGKNTFKKKKKERDSERKREKKRERCLILELICKIKGEDKGLVYIACMQFITVLVQTKIFNGRNWTFLWNTQIDR